MAVRTALFADPDRTFGSRLKTLAQNSGIVAEVCNTSEEARRKLVTSAPLVLFSNMRLGGVRGPDLVYLAKMANPRTRTVLYGSTADALLARQAQAIGAFFELTADLPNAMRQYFSPTLPPRDRRGAAGNKRRQQFRGGRRSSDVERLHV